MSEPLSPDQSENLGSSGKRKRTGPSSSPDERRTKRTAPNATAGGGSPPDTSTAAFIESAVEAAQAAAASGVNVADIQALQHAAAAEHSEVSDPANASSTAAAALGSMYPTLHIPSTTEEQFASQAVESESHPDPPYNGDVANSDGMMEGSGPPSYNGVKMEAARSSASKPTVGSEEWHKMRKDNHKEVERRRRETINEGINELAKIVPGCEKNKGSILQRAVVFISQLKENEEQNIEKWTLEKLLTEQAISELSTSNDKLKGECARLYRELETWKHVAQKAGLQPPQPTEETPAAAPSASPPS